MAPPSTTALYPWTSYPLIACGPMRLLALENLAVAVSLAGGIGFIGAGNDVSQLDEQLGNAQRLFSSSQARDGGATQDDEVMPIGVGYLLWGFTPETLESDVLPSIRKFKPAAVWLYAARHADDNKRWAEGVRRASPRTQVWVQTTSVAEAVEVCKVSSPDVLVVQGIDSGGHGLIQGAGVISLLPEVIDALKGALRKSEINTTPLVIAAGGIADGRGVAAALALGADGAVMGTRYLASHEVNIKDGYRDEVVRASDGGQTTARTKVYDILRGTTEWPEQYGGRGILNQSYYDWMDGMSAEKNKRLYKETEEAMGDQGWGPKGRMTTYAGTNVGLVTSVQHAGDITREVREDCKKILGSLKRDI